MMRNTNASRITSQQILKIGMGIGFMVVEGGDKGNGQVEKMGNEQGAICALMK